MKEVTVSELKAMRDAHEDFVLIDVREPYEYEIGNLGGILIPMGEIAARTAEIPTDKKVVVHCRAGSRSATVINYLETQHGYSNLHNLKGGVLAWAQEIDPTLPTY